LKLLVATDFSPASPTIETLKARPWPASTEVCVLHVVDLAPFEPSAEILETARRGAESVVQALVADLKRSGLQVKGEVITGHPRSGIAEFAKTWGADFILMGSHGMHGLARFFLGSTARAAVRAAPCSVEVVRTPVKDSSAAEAGWKILLPSDGSDCAKKAARSLAERPWPEGTVVRVASVVAPFMPFGDAGAGYFEVNQVAGVGREIEAEMQIQALRAIAETAEVLRSAGMAKIEKTAPINGDPKRAIVEEASKWEATMIVVGSHGRHGVDRLLMGSVSEFVAMHAHCSVEVIR
jgi:nucleotide-binding universal stress UspA family protein